MNKLLATLIATLVTGAAFAQASAPATPAFEEAGEIRIVGHVDHQGDELVAALAGLAGETLALEAQHLARARPLGHAQHHRNRQYL